jgi:hypothetical protein
VILDMLELGGHASAAFWLALGGFWVGLPLWLASDGFRRALRWRPLASLALGLAGSAAAVPPLVAAAVLAANLMLWSMMVMLGVLLFIGLLLRIVTAPLRRW